MHNALRGKIRHLTTLSEANEQPEAVPVTASIDATRLHTAPPAKLNAPPAITVPA